MEASKAAPPRVQYNNKITRRPQFEDRASFVTMQVFRLRRARLRSRGVGLSWVCIGACALLVACGGSSTEGGGAKSPGGDTSHVGDTTDNGAGDAADTGSQSDGSAGQTGDTNDGNGTDVASGPDGSGDATGDSDSAPAPAAKDAKFKPAGDPVEMSKFLVAPAEKAMKEKKYPLAIAYYQGLVAARGKASKEAMSLVEALVQENQYQRAIDVLDDFIAATDDPKALRQAKTARENLAKFENPFSREFKPVYPGKEAGEAFKLGRKAFKAKKYADALLYYQIGVALDPDLVGFLREIGATYDKLGAVKEKVDYLGKYLWLQPFGKNSDFARKLLAKHKKLTSRLSIVSPLPCDYVWLNGQLVPHKLPVKNLLVGPGYYAAICWNQSYELQYVEEIDHLDAGKQGTIKFNWAVIVNKLENPYGRVQVEDALNPGTMRSVPLSLSKGFGIPVPADGRALKVHITSLNGAKDQTRYIKIAPGSTEVVKW